MNSNRKGDIAELAVASDLTKQGYGVAFPYGVTPYWDLLAFPISNPERFLRIQVKYSTPKNGTLPVKCKSQSYQESRPYTEDQLDWLAVYDGNSQICYYVRSSELRINTIFLRLVPSSNNQSERIRWAKDYMSLESDG